MIYTFEKCLWQQQKKSCGLPSATAFRPLWVDGDPQGASGQGVALPSSIRKGGVPPGQAQGFPPVTGSGWPTAVSTRAWSSPAAASCTPSPASSTSGSRAGSRQSRWAAAGRGVLDRAQSRSGCWTPNAAPASWHFPGPADGGAGGFIQLPAGVWPLPHPEVPVCLPLICLGLPSSATVSPQVCGVRGEGTAHHPQRRGSLPEA